MIFKLLIFGFWIIILFIPIYNLINYLYKKYLLSNTNNNLIDELEKTQNNEKQIKLEISEKINKLEEETNKLKNIK